MLSGDEKFINKHYLDYTKKSFLEYFGQNIFLKKEEYSNEAAGMGFYRLNYEYSKYQIVFEYERLRFTIRIKWKDAVSNFFSQHKELSNSLKEEDINQSISVLKNDIDNGCLDFFRISKKGEIKKIEGALIDGSKF
ncbi:hypothetical protein ACWOC1_03620 [Enterococcus quebecensis]|uniref:Uncharacterized protein n=1 Tax=Enterococcus quebecensis TaxID=903983 RepID=A0A1E5GRE2_9ENTE|nr:hypothetical protein [Enterococcus quebecensis]OEG15135.1 hypothetical protein BCR23_09860 [Enterococcus quebecensis]